MTKPAPITTAASGVAIASLGLAVTGFTIRWLEVGEPILALGCMVVALGGAILGGTLSAVGLMVTRSRSDRAGRRRAWLGAVISLGVLLGLLVGLERALSEPIVIPPDSADRTQSNPIGARTQLAAPRG